MAYIKKLLDFINQSPTAFHAVASVREELLKNSYTEFSEGDTWRLSKARKGFVIRNSSALIAFAIPEKPIKGFHIFSAPFQLYALYPSQ